MTLEDRLIQKTYYKHFINDNENRHPIEVLGEAAVAEQEKESYDLSDIRFAQGEVYYHSQDFETAIFKWENINSELEPWAKKNIGDTYYKTGRLSDAEEIYLSLKVDDPILTAEVSLQLFSLYIDQDNIERAYEVIKEAVKVNPAYPGITELARKFYERQEDWESATELAVSESLRTEDLFWFATVIKYAKNQYTTIFSPDYFYQVLITFYKTDQMHFKKLVSALWESYKNEETYLEWIKTINDIFLNVDIGLYEYWQEISSLYEESYLYLISGSYDLQVLHDFIPTTLENWLKVTRDAKSLFPAAAIWTWNEQFPSTIMEESVQKAESTLFNSDSDIDGLSYSLNIVESMMSWAKQRNIELDPSVASLLNKNVHHLLMIDPENDEETTVKTLHTFSREEDERTWMVVDGSSAYREKKLRQSLDKWAPLGDSLLFIVHPTYTFSEDEREELRKLEQSMPVRFLIKGMDAHGDIESRLRMDFQDALISVGGDENLTSFIQANFFEIIDGTEKRRIHKLLSFMRITLHDLGKRRVEEELYLQDLINTEEQKIEKLGSDIEFLRELEKKKSRYVTETYAKLKDEIKDNFENSLPNLLRECTEIITEDSDFANIHKEVNDKMNKVIEVQWTKVLTDLQHALQQWLSLSREELVQSQESFDDLAVEFNNRFAGEKVELKGDFKILDDWRRDIRRLTVRMPIEEQNIFLQSKFAQLMFQRAGKLIGALASQKTMYNQYKKNVDSQDYEEAAQMVTNRLFAQFNSLENSLKLDVETFFSQPFEELTMLKDGTEVSLENNRLTLKDMKENPGEYYNPIKLFEIRVRQYEVMIEAKEEVDYREILVEDN